MNRIDDIREVLAEREAQAPHGNGLLDLVYVRAAQVRRRKRLTGLAGGILALVMLGAAAQAILDRPLRNSPGITPTIAATPTPLPHYRKPLEMTVDAVAGSQYRKAFYGVVGTEQHVEFHHRSGNQAGPWGGRVIVHDPGAFDGSAFEAGRPAGLPGRNAYFAGGKLGWQEASGAWVVVFDPNGEAEMLVVAQQIVFLAQPRPITTPFRLDHVPAGLRPVHTLAADGVRTTQVGLDPVGPPKYDPGIYILKTTPMLMIRSMERHPMIDGYRPTDIPPVRVNGNDVYYITSGNAAVVPAGGTVISIYGDKCWAGVTIGDNNRIPRAEQERIVAGLRFNDCTDPATWTVPIG